jgi:hypothetical protein
LVTRLFVEMVCGKTNPQRCKCRFLSTTATLRMSVLSGSPRSGRIEN